MEIRCLNPQNDKQQQQRPDQHRQNKGQERPDRDVQKDRNPNREGGQKPGSHDQGSNPNQKRDQDQSGRRP